MMKLISKILKIASYIVFGAVICISVFVLALRFMGESPSVFGYSCYYVLTQSMEPEILAGDMILGKKVAVEELQIGDIITYEGETGSFEDKIITHKIIDIQDGSITTQGVANDLPDPPIVGSQVISRYVATVPCAGKIFSLINSKLGFLFLIVTPLVLLIINEVSIIVKAFKEEKEEHLSD